MKKTRLFSLIIAMFFAFAMIGGSVVFLDENFADVSETTSVVQDCDGDASNTATYESSDLLSANEETSDTEIQTAGGFLDYVNSWSTSSANVTISSNIDMSGYSITNTIGNSTTAFSGIFDGQGHTISNLTISLDISSSASSTAYLGLFGYASGATIKNVTFQNLTIQVTGSATTMYVGLIGYATNCTISAVSVSGSISFAFDGGALTYVGGVVGKADSSAISMVQTISSSSAMSISSTFSGSTYLGLLAGGADASSISQIIVRRSLSATFSSSIANEAYVGAVGSLVNGSTLTFADIEAGFGISSDSNFSGDVYVGGAVGLVADGTTKLQSVAISNSFTISDDAECISVGEVVGSIGTPVPTSGNISYIHFASNGYDKFADMGSYSYSDSGTVDYVTAASLSLTSLTSNTDEDGNVTYTYFTSQSWAPLLGDFDFDTVFYVNSSNLLSLQCFYTNYSVTSKSTSVMTASIDATDVSYGDSLTITFKFKADNYSKYYTPTYLLLNGSTIATIYSSSETYSISTPDVYKISAISGGFEITVVSLNMSTAGEYSVSCTANTYSMTVISAVDLSGLTDLDEDGLDALKGGISTKVVSNLVNTSVNPGYVYYSTSVSNTTKSISRSVTIESTIPTIQTALISGQPYAFTGFWLIVSDDKPVSLVESSSLVFSLENFSIENDFQIYALYDSNACVISFDIDDGVYEIYVSESLIGEELQTTVSKSLTEVKIEIRIQLGYELDVVTFEDFTDLFIGNINRGEVVVDEDAGYTSYTYTLNMTELSDEMYSNALSLKVHTTIVEDEIPAWVWWLIVGIVVGLVLIGLIVWLVIYLVRKRKNGGFGGGFRHSRRSGGFY